MNCAVCGNPLLCTRAIFRCSCGVFVHAYCWEKHVVQAHQPAIEMGAIDLNGEFIASGGETEQAPGEQITSPTEETSSEETVSPAELAPGEEFASPTE